MYRKLLLHMFSRILLKLIDQAIVPALLLLSARIVSVVLVSRYFRIPFDINQSGFVFNNPRDYVLINTYSTFIMMVVLIVGLFYILLKAYVFHESHVSPHVSAKLHNFKLSSFIQASYDLYSQGTIWLSYSYFLTIVSGLLGVFGLIGSWVFFAGLLLNVIATFLLIFDVEKEVQIKKSDSQNVEFDTDEIYLEDKHETYSQN